MTDLMAVLLCKFTTETFLCRRLLPQVEVEKRVYNVLGYCVSPSLLHFDNTALIDLFHYGVCVELFEGFMSICRYIFWRGIHRCAVCNNTLTVFYC